MPLLHVGRVATASLLLFCLSSSVYTSLFVHTHCLYDLRRIQPCAAFVRTGNVHLLHEEASRGLR